MPLSLTGNLKRFVDSRPFNFFIIGCIALTSIAIGMDTYP